MRYMSITEMRHQLPAALESGERIVLTKNGQPAAVVLTVDDFRALQAVQALARNPDALGHVLAVHTRVREQDTLDGLEEFVSAPSEPARAAAPSFDSDSIITDRVIKVGPSSGRARRDAQPDAGGAGKRPTRSPRKKRPHELSASKP